MFPKITSKRTQVQLWKLADHRTKELHLGSLLCRNLGPLNVHIRKQNQFTTSTSVKDE
jgi:hypothetical protein